MRSLRYEGPGSKGLGPFSDRQRLSKNVAYLVKSGNGRGTHDLPRLQLSCDAIFEIRGTGLERARPFFRSEEAIKKRCLSCKIGQRSRAPRSAAPTTILRCDL